MIIFGKDATTGNPLHVSLESLHSGSYILGLPGTGKSTLLNSLCVQLMKQGESTIVFDPKGDLVDGIIGALPVEAIQNTYLLDLTNDDFPFALNVFSYPDPKNISKKDRAATPNLIYQAFAKRWPEVEHGRYFKNILWGIIPILLEHKKFTLMHVRTFLRDKNFRQTILKDVTDTECLDFWEEYEEWPPSEQRKERKPFLDRMTELFRDPYVKYIVCQKQGLVDFRQAIMQKKHFLIKLPILESAYQYAGTTIGIFLLLQIYAATFSFASIPQSRRPKFTLIIDEFSQFAFGGEEFSDLFNFGRGLGIRQILAHQTREQLKNDESLKPIIGITKGARTVVCLKLNPIDAGDMASIFTGLKRTPTDIYIDVLDRLEKHPNAQVKEFYWHYVTKLQEAAKKGEEAQGAVRTLNNVLYYSQKNKEVDNTRLEAFLKAYSSLSHQTKTVKRMSVDPEWYKREAGSIEGEIKKLLETWKEEVAKEQERCDRENEQEKEKYAHMSDESKLFIQQTLRRSKSIGPIQWKPRAIPFPERIHFLRGLVAPIQAIEIEVPVVDDTIRGLVFSIAQILTREPLAADKSELSNSDIETILQSLPLRQAYVNSESQISVMHTYDLPPSLPYAEFRKRKNHIIKQTKDKYCQGRKEVEKEIETIFQVVQENKPVSSPVNKPFTIVDDDDDIIE